MPVAFAAPEYLLLLLVLLPLVWLLGRHSLSGLDSFRRRLSLGLRSLVVLLLVLALAEVEWRDLTERVEVIFVVDHSRSIPDEQHELAKTIINEAQAKMDPRRDLGKVVVFGRDASTETKLQRDRAKFERVTSLVDRNHSDIEQALERALEALEQDVRGRIVLLSDGNQTIGDASAAIARARAAHVPVDVLPLEYAYGEELLVEKVVLPTEAKTGEPFVARVVTHAVKRTRAVVKLSLNGGVIESREVVLEPGPNVEEFQLDLKQADFYRVRAMVEPVGAREDQLIQNNTAHGFVFARGKQQLLYVQDELQAENDEGRHLLEGLLEAQMRVKAITPGDFPLEPLELQTYDAIVLDDVERASFSERQQQAIESAVGDMGLGLVMIGGERGFGAGDWRGSPVEDALPVEMDIKQEEVIPDGALVMIIHSCEAPTGNAQAIKVTKQAIDGMSSKDTVGVLIFGPNGNEWVIKPQKARHKMAMKNRVHQMQPYDMPDFDGIFRMALQALKKQNASVKHMILMSDGDPNPPAPSLLRECQQKKITVSTICYASHEGAQGPNAQAMRRIASMTGGKYYYLNANDMDKLPRIFVKESQRVARSLIVNQTFVPQQRTNSTLLSGLSGYPPLTGYVLTEAKPRAEVPLVSPDGSPVLAHWFYGVGKSVAFTSDAKARWAANWVQWGGFRTFWAQTLRWVSKDVQESYFSVQTRVKGDKGVVVLDAVTPEGELVDGLAVKARITPPDAEGQPQEVDLIQKGPGRYESEFPIDEVGTYNVHLITTEDGQPRHSVTTGLVFPYSEEFRKLRSDLPALEELARQGDGQAYDPDAAKLGQVDFWDRESLGQKIALEERWSWALAAALLLFLLDVAVRRVAIDYDKLWARAAAVVRRQPKPAGGRTMDRLRERKASVREASSVPAPPVASGPAKKFEAKADVGDDVQVARQGDERIKPTLKPKPSQTQTPQEEGSTYSRLLKAKRRARQDMQAEDETKDKD